MSKEYLEAFKIVYNNFDYLISDVGIENDDVNICLKTIKEQLPTIKQALLKAEEQENKLKALEIIKEKDVDIFMLRRFKTLEAYNNYAKENKMKELTQEEFNTLKEVIE